MLYLTCTTITSVDLAHYGVSRAKIGYLWIVVPSMFFIGHNTGSKFTGTDRNGPYYRIGPYRAGRA